MTERVITTGGTIDKTYLPTTGTLAFDGTHIHEMLNRARLNPDELAIEELMQLDSLDMEDSDRELIAQACDKAPEKYIVITHGTDTMPETARYITQKLGQAINNKTIILTGAMIPFSIKGSDALFNLGSAFAYLRALPPGVYIAMNGQAFEANTVRKNKKLGVFEKIKN